MPGPAVLGVTACALQALAERRATTRLRSPREPCPGYALLHSPTCCMRCRACWADHGRALCRYDYSAPLSEAGRTGQPGIGGPNKFNVRPAMEWG